MRGASEGRRAAWPPQDRAADIRPQPGTRSKRSCARYAVWSEIALLELSSRMDQRARPSSPPIRLPVAASLQSVQRGVRFCCFTLCLQYRSAQFSHCLTPEVIEPIDGCVLLLQQGVELLLGAQIRVSPVIFRTSISALLCSGSILGRVGVSGPSGLVLRCFWSLIVHRFPRFPLPRSFFRRRLTGQDRWLDSQRLDQTNCARSSVHLPQKCLERRQ